VVEADVGRRTTFGGQALETGHDPVGVDGACDVDGEGFTAVLVDDVQEFEHVAVGRLVELEVERPHDVGADRAEGADGRPDAA
jgi:hypothetical protein